jgi:hypothetical protein
MRRSPQPRFDELEQVLLGVGGEGVFSPFFDPDLEAVVDRGRAFPLEGLHTRVMQANRCHHNVARLWYRTRGRVKVATGYALADNGYWYQHSWGVDGGHVIETTPTRRAGYFGVEQTFEESAGFVTTAMSPDLLGRIIRDSAAGRGFTEFFDLFAA